MVQKLLRMFVFAAALSSGLAQHAGAAEIIPDADVPDRARVFSETRVELQVLYLGRRCTGTSLGIPNVCADVTVPSNAIDNYQYPTGSEPQLARISVVTASQIGLSDLDLLVARGILNATDLAPDLTAPVLALTEAIPGLIKYLGEPLVVRLSFDRSGALDYLVTRESFEAALLDASRQNAGLPPISVPEPAALAIFGMALTGLALTRARKASPARSA